MVRWSVWWGGLLSFFESVDDLLLLDHSLAIDELLFVVKNFFSYLFQLFWPHRIDWSETFSHKDDFVFPFFWEDNNHQSFSTPSVICQIYVNLIQVWELGRGGRQKGRPDSFPPTTSTNVGISNQNVLIFRINPFVATLA